MGPQNTGNGRVRAWVLIRATPVQGVSTRLRNLDKKEDDLVMIRADVLTDSPYNIIVPVDAASETVLSSVVGDIRAINAVTEAVVLKVRQHDPDPPHDASGYITDQEADRGERKPKLAGRQDRSPGFNPWG